MKKTKLKLDRTTLAVLAPDQLRAAVGGVQASKFCASREYCPPTDFCVAGG